MAKSGRIILSKIRLLNPNSFKKSTYQGNKKYENEPVIIIVIISSPVSTRIEVVVARVVVVIVISVTP